MALTDWSLWRKCRVCGAAQGEACLVRSGRVVDGQPDRVPHRMLVPHRARRPRKLRAKG